MDHNGVMVNTSGFQSSNPISFPGKGEYDFLLNADTVNILLKNIEGRHRRPYSVIFVV